MEHSTLTAQQFGAVASAYLTSTVHAQGADLRRLTELARRSPRLAALDLGCGAGHASFALAEGSADVTAYDLSPEMLSIVKVEAQRRGLGNLQIQQGTAEHLPYNNATFDLVVTRFSSHHWLAVTGALCEAGRVLKSGGNLIVIDVVSPEFPLFDTILQTVEILRDISHVRDYRVSEWKSMFHAAGFRAPNTEIWSLPMDFKSWTDRMSTPEIRVQAIRDIFDQAARGVHDHFRVQKDYSFSIDVAWMQAIITTSVSD